MTKTNEEARAESVQDDTLADLLAQSKAALANYTKAIADIDRSAIGHWYGMPPRMQADGWMFYRCGAKNSATAQALAQTFKLHGWVDAPAGTACVGFEEWDSTRGGGLYLCCPPETYGRMKDVLRKARTKGVSKSDIEESLTKELSSLGVEIETITVSSQEMSGQDFVEMSADKTPPERPKKRG